MLRFEIDGDPVPWMRAGYNRRTGAIYDRQPKVRSMYRGKFESEYTSEPMSGPVEVEILFLLPIPASIKGRMRKDMVSNYVKHIKKPDLDNLEKLILDTMSGIIYVDDCQVTRKIASKRYSERPRVVVTVQAISNNENRQNQLEREYEEALAEQHEDYIRDRQQGSIPGIRTQSEGSKVIRFPQNGNVPGPT